MLLGKEVLWCRAVNSGLVRSFGSLFCFFKNLFHLYSCDGGGGAVRGIHKSSTLTNCFVCMVPH